MFFDYTIKQSALDIERTTHDNANMQLKLPLVNPLQAIRIPEHMPSLFSLVVTSRLSQIQPPLLPVPLLLVGTCSTKAPDTID